MKLIEANHANARNRRRRRLRGSRPDEMASADLAAASGRFDSTIARAVKRTIDVAIALPVGLVLLPWLVAIAAVIKCVSRGPVFYGQVRLGQNGRPFRMWKFRTMVEDAERCLDRIPGGKSRGFEGMEHRIQIEERSSRHSLGWPTAPR